MTYFIVVENNQCFLKAKGGFERQYKLGHVAKFDSFWNLLYKLNNNPSANVTEEEDGLYVCWGIGRDCKIQGCDYELAINYNSTPVIPISKCKSDEIGVDKDIQTDKKFGTFKQSDFMHPEGKIVNLDLEAILNSGASNTDIANLIKSGSSTGYYLMSLDEIIEKYEYALKGHIDKAKIDYEQRIKDSISPIYSINLGKTEVISLDELSQLLNQGISPYIFPGLNDYDKFLECKINGKTLRQLIDEGKLKVWPETNEEELEDAFGVFDLNLKDIGSFAKSTFETAIDVTPQYVPYQLCPKCNGQGYVSKPNYVPGNVDQWISSAASFVCDVCSGAKIIPQHKL